MHRTTIMADDDVIRRLREVARAQGRSLGEVVREALAEKASRLTPVPKSLALGDSHGAAPSAAEIGEIPVPPEPWRS